MDGTIDDFTNPAIKKVKELFRVDIKAEELTDAGIAKHVWRKLSNGVKQCWGTSWNLYSAICSEGFFLDLPPLPGAIDAVKKIAEEGIEIVFCTKVLHWRQASEKAEWLKKYFNDIEYMLVVVDKHEAKKLVDADIIIDDDPRVLDVVELPIRILIKQPWNKDHQDKYVNIAENITEAAEITIGHKPHIDFWDSQSPFNETPN